MRVFSPSFQDKQVVIVNCSENELHKEFWTTVEKLCEIVVSDMNWGSKHERLLVFHDEVFNFFPCQREDPTFRRDEVQRKLSWMIVCKTLAETNKIPTCIKLNENEEQSQNRVRPLQVDNLKFSSVSKLTSTSLWRLRIHQELYNIHSFARATSSFRFKVSQ